MSNNVINLLQISNTGIFFKTGMLYNNVGCRCIWKLLEQQKGKVLVDGAITLAITSIKNESKTLTDKSFLDLKNRTWIKSMLWEMYEYFKTNSTNDIDGACSKNEFLLLDVTLSFLPFLFCRCFTPHLFWSVWKKCIIQV